MAISATCCQKQHSTFFNAQWSYATPRSIVCVGKLYNTAHPGGCEISSYAWGGDYHDVLRRDLEWQKLRVANIWSRLLRRQRKKRIGYSVVAYSVFLVRCHHRYVLTTGIETFRW